MEQAREPGKQAPTGTRKRPWGGRWLDQVSIHHTTAGAGGNVNGAAPSIWEVTNSAQLSTIMKFCKNMDPKAEDHIQLTYVDGKFV